MLKKILCIPFCLVLVACNSNSEQTNPQQIAAKTCADEAKVRIGDKVYELDLATLTASAKLVDGNWQMQAPITIEPGLRDEVKQNLTCEVHLQKDKPSEVIKIEFIFN
ncbi:MAG: hypothetical protein KA902_04050 [Arenimonas sp.]|nr:hypothetical protein [Arenimonas sp.]